MRRLIIAGMLVCLLTSFFPSRTCAASKDTPTTTTTNNPTNPPEKPKKKHRWLIPVGAAAGFGAGLLVGFAAFDEAINSEQKIWTTAILMSIGGGLGGWAIAHHWDSQPQSAILLNPERRKMEKAFVNPFPRTCEKRGQSLGQQTNCLYAASYQELRKSGNYVSLH